MRRHLAAASAVLLLTTGLAACSESGEDPAKPSGEFPVTVEGEYGEEPTVEFKAPLKVEKTQDEVLVEGDGAVTEAGDDVLVDLYLANGRTGDKVGSTWDQGVPSRTTLSEESLFPAAYDALVGQKVGTRVAVVAIPKDAYGEAGASQLKIKKNDNVVMVMDVVAKSPEEALDAPEGTPVEPPAGTPEVVTKGDTVTGFDFSAAKKPTDKLQVIPLIEGSGPEVRDPSFVTLDYLGQTYAGKKPFDGSFGKEPVTFPLGIGNLIRAWDEGLIGVKTGSRVMLIVPPAFGYGEQGSPQAGIKGTDTLVFVVDVLGVG